MPDYLKATRHPFSSLVFVLPMLIAYEGGILLLGPAQSHALRNGADAWVRSQLQAFGINFAWTLPILLCVYLFGSSVAGWKKRPAQPLSTLFGSVLESLVYAVALWAVSRNFHWILQQTGLPIHGVGETPATIPPEQLARFIRFLGAGIYEELLFRLGLFGMLYLLLRAVLVPKVIAIPFAGVIGSLAFAAAHHIGVNGEELKAPIFAFRAVAGLFFAALFVARGFGIAVGTHAGYNILVGVVVE